MRLDKPHLAQLPSATIWRRGIDSTAPVGIVIALAVIFAAMRVTGMLGPSNLRWMLPFGFVLMTLTPWLFLNGDGRRQIGFTSPASLWSYAQGIILGAFAAIVCFGIGFALFGTGQDNWFMSFGRNYQQTLDTTGFTATKLHLVFTIPALLFSPIGEEIFFRGLLQRALEERVNVRTSTGLECAAFGIVHLCHHGLFRTAVGISFLPVSGAIWAVTAFFIGLLFATIRNRSGSLFSAVASHMSFNLTMNIIIFGVLWRYVE